ncbi:MAG TPA: aldo/keto reductase [Phycisphaerae bacterium]|nr:aldo/keto reductase [Phycisphaerae bacterium]HPP27404.1 aldo/keto reductase [Phycisphaerae bacterium]
MRLRSLGKTGLRVSAVGLGGHWRTPDGRRYYDRFDGDKVPADVVRNRADVVAACLDAGINVIDITTAAEALAYGRVLAACRDRFIIGADDYQWSARNRECCNAQALIANVERCLARLRTDYLDIWRVTAEVHGRNTPADVEAILEAADRLRSAGKIRFLGVSSHHPGWIRQTIERYPAFQIALVPFTPLSGRPSTVSSDVVQTIAASGTGLMTIKPFAGGMLFRNSTSEPAPPRSADRRESERPTQELARLALRYILECCPQIACVLAGMTTVEEVATAAGILSAPPLDEEERSYIERIARHRLSTLPPEYAWLEQWH